MNKSNETNKNNKQEVKRMLIEEIKSLRKSMDLSMLELSHFIGCSTQSIHNWENGKAKPSPYYKREIRKIIKKHRKN